MQDLRRPQTQDPTMKKKKTELQKYRHDREIRVGWLVQEKGKRIEGQLMFVDDV